MSAKRGDTVLMLAGVAALATAAYLFRGKLAAAVAPTVPAGHIYEWPSNFAVTLTPAFTTTQTYQPYADRYVGYEG